MALIKYGGGIIQMSGSVAGNTHARNRSGNYMRARTKPVNPNTNRQIQIRSCVAYLAEYWNESLSAAQRAAWNLYGASVAMKNKLGETIYLTGFNHFIRSNTIREMQHLGVIADGPTEFTLPDKDAFFSADFDESPQRITITCDWGMAWLSETGAFMHIRQGYPQNGSRNFFASPYRNVGVILGSSTPWDSPVPFSPVFALAEGQRDWVSARISRADGRLTEMFFHNALVHSQAIGEVPMLIGMLQADAEALLTSAEVGLIVGTVTQDSHATIPAGCVISSDPVAHTLLSAGDPVNMVVSSGPAP